MTTIKTMPIPLDPRSDKQDPMITNAMKAYCIGEYSWDEVAPHYDEHGNLIEHTATREVPWDLCKKIYKQMATIANGSIEMEEHQEPFGVIAGKYDGDEKNCKYRADFATMDEAIEAYDRVSGYPWAYIQYKGRTLSVFHKDVNPFD